MSIIKSIKIIKKLIYNIYIILHNISNLNNLHVYLPLAYTLLFESFLSTIILLKQHRFSCDRYSI